MLSIKLCSGCWTIRVAAPGCRSGRNSMMDRILLSMAVCFATVGTAKRIVQTLDTSIAYLVGRFEGIGDDQRSGT